MSAKPMPMSTTPIHIGATESPRRNARRDVRRSARDVVSSTSTSSSVIGSPIVAGPAGGSRAQRSFESFGQAGADAGDVRELVARRVADGVDGAERVQQRRSAGRTE